MVVLQCLTLKYDTDIHRQYGHSAMLTSTAANLVTVLRSKHSTIQQYTYK